MATDDSTATAPDLYTCPRCGERATKSLLSKNGYCCTRCAFEAAHVEVATNGVIRRVLGWLRCPGDVLQGRYQVTAVLGKGGFAATYLVEDLLLKGKRRALKEIPEDLYDDYETTLLSALDHPAIPDICDRFEADAMVYLLLEFGGTRTLEAERRAAGGTVPVEKLVAWMRELCDALTYLHGRVPPIVHRDLKPENILLDDRGRVMLIDFGIAKESQLDAATRTVARSASHGFSPPEQAMGTGTDQRSDVYALGATMYALLTGRIPPPAHQRVAGATLAPPSSLNLAVPATLEAAILRALELNVNQRQQSITELATVFTSLETTAPPRDAAMFPRTERVGGTPAKWTTGDTTVPPTMGGAETVVRPAGRRWLLPAGAIAALAIAAVGWWALRRPDVGKPVVPSVQATAENVSNVPVAARTPSTPLVIPPPLPRPETGTGDSAAAALSRRQVEEPSPPVPEIKPEMTFPEVKLVPPPEKVARPPPPKRRERVPPPRREPPPPDGPGSWGNMEYQGGKKQQ